MRCGRNFEIMVFKLILRKYSLDTRSEIFLKQIPDNLIN